MHISLGIAKYEGDAEVNCRRSRLRRPGRLKQGYAALVLEQRCFGERLDGKQKPEHVNTTPRCHLGSMGGLLIGRTMIGERVWDVSRAIDTLIAFK